MFLVVIQLGAILAVVILFWEKMWPFQRKTATQPAVRWDTIQMWLKVVVACIPGAVVTILFDDYIEARERQSARDKLQVESGYRNTEELVHLMDMLASDDIKILGLPDETSG